jgi:hypothetical protein
VIGPTSRAAARVAWWALLAINLLVVAKYASRVGAPWWVAAGVYAAGATVCTLCVARGATFVFPCGRRVRWGLVGASLVLQVASLVVISPETLRVDRWSAMTAFNSAVLNGTFPYAERTHLGSPLWGLPAAYLVGLPFQWLGDVGYLQVATFLVFVFVCRRLHSDRYDVSPALALLATSPLFLWEVAVRSDLISNALLAVLVLFLCERWRDRLAPGRAAVLGGLIGLLACTRVVLLAPLTVYMATYFRRDQAQAALTLSAAAAGVAAAVVAPFILWSPSQFANNNPFVLQTALSPVPLRVGAVVMCLAAGLAVRGFGAQCLAGGLVLSGGVAAAFCLRAAPIGWSRALFDSGFDISYFDLSAPFLVVPLLFAYPVAEGADASAASVGDAPADGGR